MKLNNFLNSFLETSTNNYHLNEYSDSARIILNMYPDVLNLLNTFSGNVYENGLFKIHNLGSSYYWTQLSFEYFKKFKGKSYCFAFDWLGRQYAINNRNGKSIILMLDPATAEVFELERSLEAFFNIDLVEFKGDILESSKFNSLAELVSSELRFEKCIGFKQPLFLGGIDDVTNLEVYDLEVYWELNFQIYNKVQNLPQGTLISNISLD